MGAVAEVEKVHRLVAMVQSEDTRKAMASILPRHCNADRMTKIILNCFRKVPKLLNCSPASFNAALIKISETGLEPGSTIHLIPFGEECQVIIDYKGLKELVMRSGQVSAVGAEVVYDSDVFETNLGQVTKHQPDWTIDKPGKVICVYAWALMKGTGQREFRILRKSEVDAVRAKSRAGQSGPWKDHYNEMAKKTAFRNLCKWLPLSAEIQDLVAKDDDQFDFNQPAQRQTLQGVIDAPADIPVITGPFQDEPEEPADAGTPQVSDTTTEPASAPTQADERDAAKIRKRVKSHVHYGRITTQMIQRINAGKTDFIQLNADELEKLEILLDEIES